MTPKQEAFCLAYIETGNASEAYRRAYSVAKMKPEAISIEACRLLDNPKVTLRLKELRKPIIKRHTLTVDDIIAELDEARKVALEADTPQSSAAISASMGKAKLLGMLMDKVNLSGDADNPVAVTMIERKIVKTGN